MHRYAKMSLEFHECLFICNIQHVSYFLLSAVKYIFMLESNLDLSSSFFCVCSCHALSTRNGVARGTGAHFSSIELQIIFVNSYLRGGASILASNWVCYNQADEKNIINSKDTTFISKLWKAITKWLQQALGKFF